MSSPRRNPALNETIAWFMWGYQPRQFIYYQCGYSKQKVKEIESVMDRFWRFK